METNKITTDGEILAARQKEVDADRTSMKSKLSPEDQLKHEVVEEAIDLLARHKIMAFIYADVPHIDTPKGIPSVHQYNTIANLAEYEEDGTYTEAWRKKMSLFNSCMWDGLFTTITVQGSTAIKYGIDKLDWFDKEEFSKVMHFFDSFVLDCVNTYHKAFNAAKDEERNNKTDS